MDRIHHAHLNRRRLLQGTAGVTAATALAGRGVMSAHAQSCDKLTVWGVVSFNEALDQKLCEQMMALGQENGIEVEYVALPGSDYTTRVATAVETGAVPDVVMMLGDLTIFYADQDRLVDLTDLYNELNELGGGIYDQLLPHVSVGDQVYSIPMQADLSVMYARLDLVEEATGAREAPKTLEELEEVATAINNPPMTFGIGLTLGRTPDANGQLNQLIFAYGGTLVDEEGNPAINNEGTVQALETIKRWWDAGLIPQNSPSWDDSGNNTAYNSGQAAFVFNPASIFAYLEANDPELLAETTQAPMPEGPAGAFPTVGTWSWSIFNTSPCIEPAKEMIRAIMQPEPLQEMYEAVGGRWYPVYRDLAQAQFWADRPFFNDFPAIIESAREAWYPAEATPLLLTQLSAYDQTLIGPEVVQQVLLGSLPPAEAAETLQTRMEEVFAEAAGDE